MEGHPKYLHHSSTEFWEYEFKFQIKATLCIWYFGYNSRGTSWNFSPVALRWKDWTLKYQETLSSQPRCSKTLCTIENILCGSINTWERVVHWSNRWAYVLAFVLTRGTKHDGVIISLIWLWVVFTVSFLIQLISPTWVTCFCLLSLLRFLSFTLPKYPDLLHLFPPSYIHPWDRSLCVCVVLVTWLCSSITWSSVTSVIITIPPEPAYSSVPKSPVRWTWSGAALDM